MTGKRTEKLQVSLSDEELVAIDNWRFNLRMPSRAAAIRQLIHIGLANVKSGDDISEVSFRSNSHDIGVIDTPFESTEDE